jgi:hypothetical protein
VYFDIRAFFSIDNILFLKKFLVALRKISIFNPTIVSMIVDPPHSSHSSSNWQNYFGKVLLDGGFGINVIIKKLRK